MIKNKFRSTMTKQKLDKFKYKVEQHSDENLILLWVTYNDYQWHSIRLPKIMLEPIISDLLKYQSRPVMTKTECLKCGETNLRIDKYIYCLECGVMYPHLTLPKYYNICAYCEQLTTHCDMKLLDGRDVVHCCECGLLHDSIENPLEYMDFTLNSEAANNMVELINNHKKSCTKHNCPKCELINNFVQ